MTCTCGHERPEHAKFCPECGAAFAPRCASCGADLTPAAKFCAECGADVRRLATPTPVSARKVVTILFADLAGSTALHERLDPESVNGFMENYYQAMRGAVEAHRGTVVKFLGDGVMAAFGVPRVAEDDALRAVRAGVAMQRAFDDLAHHASAAVAEIGLRVALNTGEVVVNADNTDVVGDPVNVAARLQQEARNGDVVLGESTHRLVAALVTLEPLGNVTLKGRAEAVQAYRVESLERPVGTAAVAFVGRDAELGRITAVYDAAVSGPAARLAVLLGSPGLGKSRMVEEFTHRLGGAATVLTAQCDAAGGATFAPLAEALRELLAGDGARRQQSLDTAPEKTGPTRDERKGDLDTTDSQPLAPSSRPPLAAYRGAQAAEAAPALAQGNAPGGGGAAEDLRAAIAAALPGTDAERDRITNGIAALLAGSPAAPEETFFVLRRFLAALASVKPVVLVIDDLQWAEPLLLDLVEHLVQWGSGVPLLVLVGARPELRDLRSSLATPGGLVADVLTLSGLDAGAAMRLAANVIGAADLPAAVAAKVLATSEGNPLFVGELVRMLVQEGALTKEGDRWIPGVALAALEMPPTIHALLAARIERLRPEERSVLERAAVIGRHFSRSAVAELLPRDVVDLDARLEALRRSELIQRDTGWFLGEPVLRFHHILIRDAAYRRLLKGTRAELHTRFADWVAARAGDAADHDEMIGWHLEQAHQLLRELGPLDAAGRVLGERAAQHLSAAGRRALARDDVPVAADLLGRAVDRLDVDDPARADLALDWCEALLSAGDVGPAAAQAIDELGRVAFREGEAPAEPAADSDTARREPRPPTLSEAAGHALNRLRAWYTCFTCQLTVLTAPQKLQAAADAVAAAATELAKLGDAAGEAKAHSVHATALARLGKVGACEAALDQALAAARRAGDRRRANAVLAGAPLAALWGPSPVTRASGRCLDVVRVLRITQGAPAVESVALSCQGVLEALRGRTEAARRMLASSRKMVEDLGIAHRLFEADAFAGRIAAMEGDAPAAERLLRGAYEGLRELGLGIDAARAGALLARTLLAQDRVAEAESLSHESERLAGDDLQAAIAWRGVRAEALAKRGEHAEAVELARAAVAIASSTDALLDHADARMALAAALRAAGRGTEAAAEERRAIELWEAKGATLLAERVRSDRERPAPTVPAAAPIATPTAVRRRVRPNAATAMQNRFDAALAARDFDAIATQFRADHQEIDHPTGSTYGRDACIASLQRLFRSRDPLYEVEPLATVGEFLLLVRRRSSASGAASGPYDVGAYENEAIQLFEVDESGLCARAEVFAADRLGNAVARLYVRYAELLPDGPERARAAATARSFGVMLTSPGDIDRTATVIAPDFESVDHRPLSTWSMRGGGAYLDHIRALAAVATDIVIGVDDVLALAPNALLVRRMHSGTERVGEGAYERPFLVLFATQADGRVSRAEWFDADREVEALTCFEALADMDSLPLKRGGQEGLVDASSDQIPLGPPFSKGEVVRRRVRANAATRRLERQWTAVEARDVDALTALSAGAEVIHHPTGATYGAAGIVAMFRGLWRGTNLKMKQEILATLGDSLALLRRLASHDGVDAQFGSVGPVEVEFVGVFEVDERTQAKRSEIFAADRLGEAITRLYARYAELLPEGPERERAAATARSVAVVAPGGFDRARYAEVFRSDVEIVDHKLLGLGTGVGVDTLFRSMAAGSEVGDQVVSRPQDVLALTHDALLLRWLASGVGRESGGAFEWAFLRLFVFDADGRVARYELFDDDCEAAALARFEEIVGTGSLSLKKPVLGRVEGRGEEGLVEESSKQIPLDPPFSKGEAPVRSRRRVRPNTASRNFQRFGAAIAARDANQLAQVFTETCQVVHHPTGAAYGRREMLGAWRSAFKAEHMLRRQEILATLGDALALGRHWVSIEGLTDAGVTAFGRVELEEIAVAQVDDLGCCRHMEIFAADRLGEAIARLYQRYAELLPEGPARNRAATVAQHVATVGPTARDASHLDRLAELVAPDFEGIDHRRLSTWSARGADAYLEHLRALDRVATDLAFRQCDLLALEPAALLTRCLHSGIERIGGGTYERPFLSLFAYDHAGLLARAEWFDDDREAEALARFEEIAGGERQPFVPSSGLPANALSLDTAPKDGAYSGRTDMVGPRIEGFANTASRSDSELFRCFNGRDWEGVLACVAPVMVFDERRRLVRNTCDRDVWLEQFRFLFDVPKSRFTSHLRATRGERLALNFHRFEGEVAEGGGPLAMEDHFALHEVDADGRIVGLVLFDLEDEDAAYAELDARFEAGEASAYPRLTGALATNRLMQARDWRAYAARLAPGFVYRDHRRLGWGDAGHDSETLIRIQQSAFDLSPDARYRADHIRLSARGILRQATLLGTRDGGAFETPMFIVAEVDEQGRVVSNDTYDIEDRDGALARFAELGAPTSAEPHFENAASHAWREVSAALQRRDVERFAALHPPAFRYRDHRRLVQLDLDRDGYLAFARPLLEMRSTSAALELLATRGDRLALLRPTLEIADDSAGPSAVESLLLIETDEHGAIVAYDRYELDDEVAARAEIQARWWAGEGAAFAPAAAWNAGFDAAVDRRDWDAAATFFAPAFVGQDHRLVSWGTLHGPAGFLVAVQALVELAPDARIRTQHLRASSRALLLEKIWSGTRDGGAFENPFLGVIELDGDGRAIRMDVYDPHHLERARARFAEIGAEPNPLASFPAREGGTEPLRSLPASGRDRGRGPLAAIVKPNAAAAFLERAWAAFDVVDLAAATEALAAARPFFAPDFVWEDRRPIVGLSGGLDLMLASARERLASGARHQRRTIVGTAGDRVAVGRILWAGGPPEGRFEVEFLAVHEVNEAGLCTALIFFDSDAARAAQREAWARWAAIDPVAAPWVELLTEITDAWNSRDRPRLRARFADDLVVEDHRHAGLGRIEGGDAYIESNVVLWELAPDQRLEFGWSWPAVDRHGLVVTLRRHGTLADGGAFESEYVWLALASGGRLTRVELFEIDALDTALARFEELRPPSLFELRRTSPGLVRRSPAKEDPLRIPAATEHFENTASRAWRGVIAVWRQRDVQRFAALHPPALRYCDHRRLFQLDLDRDGFLAFTRPLLEMRSASASLDLIATRGERLALMRFTLETADDSVGPSAIDSLLLIETDERGAIVAYDRYDIDDHEAAYAELDARWTAGAAAAHPLASTWLAEYLRFFAARDWNAMTTLLAPELVGQNHRLVGWGTLHGPGAIVSTLQAQIELAPDTQERVDHVRTCEDAVLFEYAWHGTYAGGAFENLWIVLVELDDAGLARRADVWEAEQLERARAHFEEIAAKASPLAPFPTRTGGMKPNAATASMERAWAAFDARDFDAARALCAPGFRWEDRRPLVGLSGDFDLMLASLKERLATGARHERREIVGTAGDRVALARVLWAGGPADGRFEVEFFAVHEVDEAGLCTAMIFLDPDDARAAQREAWARCAAIEGGGQGRGQGLDALRIPPNAATKAVDCLIAFAEAGEWAALRTLCAPIVFEDRRRLFRTTGDCEQFVTNSRFIWEAGMRPSRTLLATAGDRLALDHMLWIARVDGQMSEVETLEVFESDGEGRIVAVIIFDSEDRAAASAELFERYVARGAVGIPASGIEFLRAMNAHDTDRVRAVLPDDFIFHDHRRTGLGRIEGADAYMASLAAIWQLSHDVRLDQLYDVATAPHGRLAVGRTSGTNLEGGEFESVYISLVHVEGERFAALELFEVEALDAALARFDELCAARTA